MKKGARYIVAAFLLYAFFLLLTLPAGRAAYMLKQRGQLPANVKVSSLSGTWMNGRAALVVVDNIELTNLVWHLHILPLFIGRLQTEVKANIGAGNLRAVVSLGRKDLLIKNIVGLLPVEVFNDLVAPFGIVLTGKLAVNLTAIRMQADKLQAVDGQLTWQAAGMGGGQELEFGDLKVKLVSGDNKINLNLSDDGGPLQLEGAGDLSPGGKYTFTGFVAVRQNASPELGDTVRLLGESGSDGRVALSYQGRLAGI